MGCFFCKNYQTKKKKKPPILKFYLIYKGSATPLAWFDSYHPYADHLRFLSDLHSRYKANSEIIFAGKSAQGQSITGIHIYGKMGKEKNPAVVFHGTVHAREWITTLVIIQILFIFYTKKNYNILLIFLLFPSSFERAGN